ncbi:MAG TPA: orotidine-5'-phosphate decarboxylase [Firmicutes bacterium]|nr:orotidine-5'-phosphate decarboxylase [Bacillota bacterium]
MKPGVIVALDLDDLEPALDLARRLVDITPFFKVGLELFCLAGPEAVRRLRDMGAEVFLDLKFHDIPNTVAGAVRSVMSLAPFMLTLHASGGREMLSRAVAESRAAADELAIRRPRLLGVTLLTSIDQDMLSRELGVARTVEQHVAQCAGMCLSSGLDGVIASPGEVQVVRDMTGPDFLIVTPGVRPAGQDPGDQRRVATPGEAIRAGADFVVVGRPITRASDPRGACLSIYDEICDAYDRRNRRC